jgi:hypothetical protein
MADKTGLVSYLKINNAADTGSDFALVGFVENGQTNAEVVFVWFSPAESDSPTAADWILRNAQLALLRDAVVNKLTVILYTDDATGFVRSVQLGATA